MRSTIWFHNYYLRGTLNIFVGKKEIIFGSVEVYSDKKYPFIFYATEIYDFIDKIESFRDNFI